MSETPTSPEDRPTRYNVKIPYITEHTTEYNVFAESEADAIRYAKELFRQNLKENCKPQGDPQIKILNPGTVCHER